ncbi:MAG: glycine--tRNA ligase subunit beta, partial [Candidatus Angelobacter sp.]
MPDFLLEIGCEEIPARMLDGAREELEKRVAGLIKGERLTESPQVESFSTPRRLSLLCRHIESAQPDMQEQLTGPATKIAFKEGKPTPAAEAFARKAGVDVAKLKTITTPKGEYLSAVVTKKGRRASQVLAELLPKEISAIYWAKNMYWRAGKPERFVRPVRWLVAMLDDEVVPLEFAGIRAGSETRGHRILSSGTAKVARAGDYNAVLAGAKVQVAAAERDHRIRKALDDSTRTIAGARWRENEDLLKSVVNLTEWPSAILGSFEPQYLALPEEVLVTV